MENTPVDAPVVESPPVAEKTDRTPATVATDIVQGTETIARDSAQMLADAAALTVEASRAAVRDVAAASEELARKLRESLTPPPVPTTVPVPPIPLAATIPATA